MLHDLLYRVRSLMWRGAAERELHQELQYHLERQAEKHMRAGVPREEAVRRARLEFGGVDAAKEASRDARGTALVEHLMRDLRYSARLLIKSPGFAAVAVLSLALGTGANTAVFQLLDSVCLRTLPVQSPESLAQIRLDDASHGYTRGNMNRLDGLTNPIWENLRQRREAFSNLFAWADDSFSTSATGELHVISGLWVSGEFFPALGIQPALGRLFAPSDDYRGCGLNGAVISYGYWQTHFGGDREVIGRNLMLNLRNVPIVGVTPPEFTGLDVGRTFEVALPICADAALRGAASRLDDGVTWWLTIMGRVRPGWNLDRVGRYLEASSPALFEATLPPKYPRESVKDYLRMRLAAYPAASGISGLRRQYQDPLWILLATAGLVLLVACANLANLMLARASARECEIAVRLAIGASRGRLIGQLLAESGLIAFLGAAAGLALSRALARLLVAMLATEGSSVLLDLRPDWRVLCFSAGLAVAACLLFGLAPALRSTRQGPGEGLRAEARGGTANRERFGLRRALVAWQIALSLVLLSGAVLFVRTLGNLASADLGFKPGGILVASVGFGRANASPARSAPLRRELMARLAAIPGVDSLAEVTLVPLGGSSRGNHVWMDTAASNSGGLVSSTDVGPGYFRTIETPVLAGRDFDERDAAGAARVAIVNEAFASQVVKGENPVGRRFWIEATPFDPQTLYEIVGVVKNTKYFELREDYGPVVYLPVAQMARPTAGTRLLIRSSLPMQGAASAIRQVIGRLEPNARFTFEVLQTRIHDSLLRERLMAALSSAFGLLAALLSAVGLYGVVSFLMAHRRSEIGIRMALGATRRDIVAMVLREIGVLLAIGIALGAVLTVLLASTAQSLLFGLKPYDPLTLSIAALGLAGVALFASYLPATRAASLNPATTLR